MNNRLLFFLLLFFGCSQSTPGSQESAIEQNLRQYVYENTNDPSGYELVKLTLTDTVFLSEHLDNLSVAYKNDSLKNEVLEEIKMIEEGALKDTIMGYYYDFKFRNKNDQGALKLNEYRVAADNYYKILLFEEKKWWYALAGQPVSSLKTWAANYILDIFGDRRWHIVEFKVIISLTPTLYSATSFHLCVKLIALPFFLLYLVTRIAQ